MTILSFQVDENQKPCSSLLAEVFALAEDEEKKKQLMTKSHSHEMRIKDLKQRQQSCIRRIEIIDEANVEINECT